MGFNFISTNLIVLMDLELVMKFSLPAIVTDTDGDSMGAFELVLAIHK